MSIAVRSHWYQDQPGFLVCGKLKGSGFSLAIFVHYRETAVAIREAKKADPHADIGPLMDRDRSQFLSAAIEVGCVSCSVRCAIDPKFGPVEHCGQPMLARTLRSRRSAR